MNDYLELGVDFINSSNIKYICDFIDNHKNRKCLITVENTSNINLESLKCLYGYSNLYVRVKSGYDDKRISDYPFNKEDYINDVIYNLYELDLIISKLNRIECEIKKEWTDIQKLFYFIMTIQDQIIYHPNFNTVKSSEIRSLRGLYTRKTVCIGYSLILKELCDRNGIECQYVEGSCNLKDSKNEEITHAWNIIKINDYYFPIDLTFSSEFYRSGKYNSIYSICDINEFIKYHIPAKHEKIQNYRTSLVALKKEYVKKIIDSIYMSKEKYSTTYSSIRLDGTKYLITLVDIDIINKKKIYKYVYSDNGIPFIIYSSTNLGGYINEINTLKAYLKCNEISSEKKEKKKHLMDKNKVKGNIINNVLFSVSNVEDSIIRGDNYVGKVIRDDSNNYRVKIDLELAKRIKKNKFKSISRSNGTSICIELIGILKNEMHLYNIYEYIKDNSKTFLKVDRIYTELNLLDSYDIDFIDAYFNRDRINRKVSLYDGYLGCRIRSGHNELLKKDNINILPSDIELYQKDDLYIGNDDLGEKKVIN